MKNTIIILLIMSFTLLFSSVTLAQEITEENYVETDKRFWADYENEMSHLAKLYELHPEKEDSIMKEANQLVKVGAKANIDTAIKFASVPSGLQRVFVLRLDIPKDTLSAIMEKIPYDMQESEYGKSIQWHINSKQIDVGDEFYNFQATESNGESFQLSSLKGKNILLLYGGVDCIQEVGRNFLKEYYDHVNREDFEIVVFNYTNNLQELSAFKNKYTLNFVFVDDFKKDHSPVKIVYGAQATPTCFMINKKGIIINRSLGLPTEELKELQSSLSQ